MKALITGASGFVGRHMVRELKDRGWTTAQWDINEGADCRDVFSGRFPTLASVRWDLVVHLAYHVGGRAAIDGEPQLLARNLELDAAMFDWAVRTSQRRVLYFSSSAAYPVEFQRGVDITTLVDASPVYVPGGPRLREDDIDLDMVDQPDGRYGWAKLTGEQLARAASEAGLPVHVVRPFSGYGEDQSLDYPFPSIVQRARKGDLSVWGPPGQTRDWIHISDVVAGALAIVDQDVREPVNLCTGVGTEMGDLMRLAAGQPDAEVTYQPEKPTGVMYRVGDPTRMSTFCQPKVSIEEGVNRALRA